tara:strand:+ start:952 stop:1119 length:168 start_codon:yes stop_codon:yes gene_type:complete
MKNYIPRADLRHHYKTTKADIAFQKRLLKYIIWGFAMFTFWSIMLVEFLFWLFRG